MSKSLPKRFVFTKGKIQALPYPDAGKDYIEFYDEGCSGLRARVQPSRKGKTKAQRIAWYFRRSYVDPETLKTKRRLVKCPDGNFDTVTLDMARAWATKVRNLDDYGSHQFSPVTKSHVSRKNEGQFLTVAKAVDMYREARIDGKFDTKKICKGTSDRYKAIIKNYLGTLEQMDVKDVTPELADQHLLWLRESNHHKNNLKERYMILNRTFEMARRHWGVLPRGSANPFDHEPASDNSISETVWSLHDLWRLWNLWPEDDQLLKRSLKPGGLKNSTNRNGYTWWQVYHDHCSALKLLALTCSRRNEISHVTWSEYQSEYNAKTHEERMCLKLSPKNRRVKAMKIKRPFIIALSQPAIDIIEWHKNEFFNGDVRKHQNEQIFASLRNTDLNATLAKEVGGKGGPRRFERNLIELRRTVSTCLHSIDCEPHIVAHIQAHKAEAQGSKAMKHYNMYQYFAEKQKWLDIWGKLLVDTMNNYDPQFNDHRIGVHPKEEGSMEKYTNATLQRLRNIDEPEERRLLSGNH